MREEVMREGVLKQESKPLKKFMNQEWADGVLGLSEMTSGAIWALAHTFCGDED